jgi:predicted amidohydrolase
VRHGVQWRPASIAAAQTVEFREDIEAGLSCVADIAARAESDGAALLCFPECFLQGYLIDEMPARRNALDLTSPAFEAVLNRLPKTGPMMVIGLIEVEEGRLFNTAIVVDRGVPIDRYRKMHLLSLTLANFDWAHGDRGTLKAAVPSIQPYQPNHRRGAITVSGGS